MQLRTPSPYAVFQRSAQNVAAIPVAGLADADGEKVFARLLRPWRRRPEWQLLAVVKDGEFVGKMPDVPTGGPYTLELQIGREKASAGNLMVGDLFILAGQSNMDGCGKLVDCEAPSSAVHCFYYDDRWDIAEDPLCRYNEAVDPVYWGLDVTEENREKWVQFDRDFRVTGAGLGVRFGKEIAKRHRVPVGLLACSHGGTSLDQWSPDLAQEGGKSLYGSLIRRVKAVGGKVAACLWYQGESDANAQAAPLFREKLAKLIRAIRDDLGQPELPFLQVQLGPFYGEPADAFPEWNRVQTEQIAIEGDLPDVATVAAVDLELSDAIHMSTNSEKILGVRLAHLASRFVYGDKQRQIGPRFAQAKVSRDRRRVEVRFTSVNGALAPKTGFLGFSLEADGQQVAIPERKLKDGSTVLLNLREPLPKGAVLWHGRGFNPAVGLRDRAGLPVPVFGPVEL
ncbi:MAG: sialate O-acetylesterase [Armatimonadetes bacterium]|nr:sialate O-acetylesterase [Armatimonadota bacterium]